MSGDFVFALALSDCGHGGLASLAEVSRDGYIRLVGAAGIQIFAGDKLIVALCAGHRFVGGGSRSGSHGQLACPAFKSGLRFDFAGDGGEHAKAIANPLTRANLLIDAVFIFRSFFLFCFLVLPRNFSSHL